jgi:uncharacterized protein YbjT (DUF2867 family)
MDIAIAGGHGNVALRLTRMLHARGDRVVSLIRKPEHADDIRAAGGDPVLCDLEAATEDAVADAIGGVQAVVFAAGAGPGSGPERKWTVDYGGAVKLIAAAKAAGVARYVMISSMGADPDAPGDDTFAVYLRAKGKADAELMESGLAYAIARPGLLNDEPGTGRVHLDRHVDRGEIPRDDVAAVLAAVLHTPALDPVVFEVVSGEVPVEDAVAAFMSRSR